MTRTAWIVVFAFATLVLACAPVPSAPPVTAPATQPGSAQGAAPSGEHEGYKVGLSAAITGPVAASYAPAYEGLKAYVEHLNRRGGIGGRNITLVALDDRAEPPRATANAKRLVEEEQVVLLAVNSASATYAPVIQAAKTGNVPLLFLGVGVCPDQVFPPQPDPLLFCASYNMLRPDAEATILAIRAVEGDKPVRLALVAADIPVSRQGVDLIEEQAKAAGMEVVAKVAIPPGTADYTPFATRFIEAGATVFSHWGPLEFGLGTFEALDKLGWSGAYVAVTAPTVELELARLRRPNYYAMPSYAFSVDGLPVFNEISDAAKAAGIASAPSTLVQGWVSGIVLEAALQRCGWPCSRDTLRRAMEGLVVTDTKGLFGGPIDWSPTNHVRSAAFYRIYRWDPSRERIVLVKDWYRVDIK